MWPRIERPENQKSTVSFKMSDLDPLGTEKKKEVVDELVALVTYIKAMEAALDAYDVEMKKHNEKFKETVIRGKSD
jgi:flagellar motor switch protein FliG